MSNNNKPSKAIFCFQTEGSDNVTYSGTYVYKYFGPLTEDTVYNAKQDWSNRIGKLNKVYLNPDRVLIISCTRLDT